MPQPKRGNPYHRPRKRKCAVLPIVEPHVRIRLSLHETDPITGNEETLSTLFYEDYRGYTIYSTEGGHCCIHGPGRRGCLRLRCQFVSFPDIEDAKEMIKYFRAQGVMSWESMERSVPEREYVCVSWGDEQRTPPSWSRFLKYAS